LRQSDLKNKWQTAEAESVLGRCLTALGRSEEAAPLLEEGFRSLSEKLGNERRWIMERAQINKESLK
jgi:hypothetical protein